jgi:cysteinyl-tRNA synthetase
MKLYNTLSKEIEEITPLNGTTYRVYSCGPTVYNHAHIGNLSAYIFADTLRNALYLTGKDIKHVMNYTDVDDKTIRDSRAQYPDLEPMAALKLLTDRYIEVFRNDMEKVGNNLHMIDFVRATETIEPIKKLIADLHARGFAYIADDGVYFSIEAYRKSGKIYGQLLELTSSNTSEARIQNDEYDKESVHDFALWKKQKGGEPAWDFTLGDKDMTGRPGWHIECSVMSRQELDQPFDIHTGGVDLIFPHHENEIAQSTALEENPIMAQVFAHNEHILVDGKKMAKSAGNFFTLQDIVDKGFEPLAFRLLVLQSHYRSQVHFSWENLEAAQNRLRHWRQVADQRWQVLQPPQFIENLPDSHEDFEKLEQEHPHTIQSTKLLVAAKEALADDLDTPQLLSVIDRFVNLVEQEGMTSFLLQNFTWLLQFVQKALGFDLLAADITDEQKLLIHEREAARAAKDWSKSDMLRDQLTAQGIGVRDTSYQGALWYRLNE